MAQNGCGKDDVHGRRDELPEDVFLPAPVQTELFPHQNGHTPGHHRGARGLPHNAHNFFCTPILVNLH